MSVALVAGSAPVLAAVFAPATDEFFFAIRDRGATRNERPVRAAAGSELDFSRMAGPKPLVQRLSPSPEEITLHPRIGSLALRLCRVADGSLDAAFAGGQSRDWDLAAANLIVQEANGRMTALSGMRLSIIAGRWCTGCWWRRDRIDMHALSSISEIVRCPELVEIRATNHSVDAAISAIVSACRASR